MFNRTLRFLAAVMVLVLALGSMSTAVYAAPSPAPGAAACTAYYVVRRGDTLTRIAAWHGTTVTTLATWNSIANPNRVYVGQRLCVSNAPSTPTSSYYTVRAGDTLTSIAWRLGVRTWDLVVANGIRNPNLIYAGQTLRIPTSGQPQTFERTRIYLIALEDNGQSGKKVGCGDSVVPVEVAIAPTKAPLRAALEKLLSIKEPYYGQSGLYNALHQSNLRVAEAKILNRQAIVHLAGTQLVSGTCDVPRIVAQLEETVLQFPIR